MPKQVHYHRHVHHHADPAALAAIATQISELGELIMAQFADIKALIPALNDATNALATKIQTLIDRLNSAPTQTDIDEVAGELTTLKDTLTAMGADPLNPLG